MGKIAATFYTVGKGQADQSVGGRDSWSFKSPCESTKNYPFKTHFPVSSLWRALGVRQGI